jgi:hypothetical protein
MTNERPDRYTVIKVKPDKLPEYIQAAQLLKLHYLVKSDDPGYEPPLLYLFFDRLAMEQYMRGEYDEEI